MTRLALLVFFSLHFFLLKSQDSLVLRANLKFSSQLEEDLFNQAILYGKPRKLELMLAMNAVTKDDVEGAFERFQNQLDQIKTIKRGKNEERYLKKVHDEIKARFLTQNALIGHMNQIFSSGTYSSISACALHAIVYEELDIAYEVRETPVHYYLVGLPESKKIVIEPSDPINGYKLISPIYKEAFVQILKNAKEVEYADMPKSVDFIFNKYHSRADKITLHHLVAMHYYNYAIEKMEGGKIQEVYPLLEKAYFIYPNEQILKLLLGSYAQITVTSSYDELEDVRILAKLEGFDSYNVNDNTILGEFVSILRHKLTVEYDTTFVKRAHDIMVSSLRSGSLKNDISYAYNYENSRLLYNKGVYDKALQYAVKAYNLKPNNVEVEDMIRGSFIQSSLKKAPPEVLDSYLILMKENPSLYSNNHFGALLLNLYLGAMEEEIKNKKLTACLELKKSFEELSLKYPDYRFEDYFLGNAYSQLAVYYFKRGKTSSARKVINKGLELSPGNSELRRRQYMINR